MSRNDGETAGFSAVCGYRKTLRFIGGMRLNAKMVSILVSAVSYAMSVLSGVAPSGFSAPEVSQELLVSGEVYVDSADTSWEVKESMMMDVQAYVDAVSVTSATPLVKASVIDSGSSTEQMRFSLIYYDGDFSENEMQVLSQKSGTDVSAINDFLCENLTYEDDLPERLSLDSPQATAKGSIQDGKAVCMGYANAFTVFAENAGIKSVKVRGYIGEVLHVVNVVDGGLVVDVTWNDKTDNRFFLVPIEEYCESTGFVPQVSYETAFKIKYTL